MRDWEGDSNVLSVVLFRASRERLGERLQCIKNVVLSQAICERLGDKLQCIKCGILSKS